MLTVTELLRKNKVVGKFVEYFGEGAASLTATDRAVVANMSPDYGATIGFFGVDEKTIEYLRMTGRRPSASKRSKAYFKAQGMFGIPRKGEIDYSRVVELDLSSVVPERLGPEAPAGPHRSAEDQEPLRDALLEAVRRRRLRQGRRELDKRVGTQRAGRRRRPRRRADRRDHLVHQHLEPQRAARRRPAREESGRERAQGAPAREDLARAGLARS